MSGEAWAVVVVVLALGAITLVGAIKLAGRLIVTRRALGELGASGKFAFYGALIYTILPVDLLPDPIYLDDIGVLAAALFYLSNALRNRERHVPPRRSSAAMTRDD